MRLKRIVTRRQRAKLARFAYKKIGRYNAPLGLPNAANNCDSHSPHVYAHCLQCGHGVCSACCPHALPAPELPLDW